MAAHKSTSLKRIPNDVFFAQIKEIIDSGESVKINVTGRSMDPTFKDGKDVLVISPFDRDTLAPGDVVLFDRGDTICVHRIIRRSGERLIIRGDGNFANALEPCTVDDVIGIVTGGTFRGGKPFTTKDRAWKRQTEFIRRFYPQICRWHQIRWIFVRYPMSMLVTLLLLGLSFYNFTNVPNPDVPFADKWVHGLMYLGVSGMFWLEWLRSHPLCKRTYLRGSIFCVGLPVILGGLIEIGQKYLTTCRQGDWYDFWANCLGVACATLLVFTVLVPLLKWHRNARKS